MKPLLILIILCGINISKAGYFERHLEPPTANFEDLNGRFTTDNTISKYPLSSENNNNRYRRQNRAIYDDVREYGRNRRYFYPHRFWFNNNLRNSLHRRFLSPIRNENNQEYFKYRHDLYTADERPELSTTSASDDASIAQGDADFPEKSQTLRQDRDRNNVDVPETVDSGLTLKAQRGLYKSARDSSNYDEMNTSKQPPNNQSSNLEEMPKAKAKRRELKAKTSSTTATRALGRFDMLYLLGLFLIFIPIASVTVIIVPLASFCWSTCKRKRTKGEPGPKPSLEGITVESALVSDPPERPSKAAAESKSYQDLYRNFVSNDINGDGDAIGKQMKIERWMTQTVDPNKPKSRFRRHKHHYNTAEMESVTEEPSDVESLLEDDMFDSGSEVASGGRDNSPSTPDRAKKGEKSKERRKANKQESQPFDVPEKVVTVGRVHNPRHMNPRHIYSLVDQPRRHPSRTSYSMVDIFHQRLPRS